MSLFNLPGIDKVTFYAAALYLHASAGSLDSEPWIQGPKTSKATRDFLDCLADCFARSKLKDARDHVSATAMVRDEKAKKIILYIAKNQSENAGGNVLSESDEVNVNENDEFAKSLIDEFNELANGKGKDNFDHPRLFEKMCKFSSSRLEHYIVKISEKHSDDLERIVANELEEQHRKGWKTARKVIDACKSYQNDSVKREDPDDKAPQELIDLAKLGGSARKDDEFQLLKDKVETFISRSKLHDLPEVIKWINYLGRLFSAGEAFRAYCMAPEQQGYTFDHKLLRSNQHEWNGNSFLKKIRSWTGNLDVAQKPEFVEGQQDFDDRSLEEKMVDIVKSSNDVARVHCEMQLLLYFSRQGENPCLDYFGCSKKSCWLCWQMLLRNNKYSIKDTHRKLYPRWAFPFDFDPLQPTMAEGIRAASNGMLNIIQEKVIRRRAVESLLPFAQSSARVTPRVLHTSMNSNSVGQSQFPGNPIYCEEAEEKGRFPAASAEALHLPPGGQGERIVKVHFYEISESERFYFDAEQKHGGKLLVPAFQLITSPQSAAKEGQDLAQSYWTDDTFTVPVLLSEESFIMFYRPTCMTLQDRVIPPNVFIRSIWREVHGEPYGDFPMGGDIFVFNQNAKGIVFGGNQTPVDKNFLFNWLKQSYGRRAPNHMLNKEELNLYTLKRRVSFWSACLENRAATTQELADQKKLWARAQAVEHKLQEN